MIVVPLIHTFSYEYGSTSSVRRFEDKDRAIGWPDAISRNVDELVGISVVSFLVTWFVYALLRWVLAPLFRWVIKGFKPRNEMEMKE